VGGKCLIEGREILPQSTSSFVTLSSPPPECDGPPNILKRELSYIPAPLGHWQDVDGVSALRLARPSFARDRRRLAHTYARGLPAHDVPRGHTSRTGRRKLMSWGSSSFTISWGSRGAGSA
jgi:hypothetical protein